MDQVKCPNCGLAVEESMLIQFGDAQVCTSCKDGFAQRLKEGSEPQISGVNSSPGYIIKSLQSESTWKLFGLGLITAGIYFGHYIFRQTKKMNEFVQPYDRIPEGYLWVVLIATYISVLQLIPYFAAIFFFPEYEQTMDTTTEIVERISRILILVWGFKFGNRMNRLLDASKSSDKWFHGLPIFFLSPLYHNYKINSLAQRVRPRSQVKSKSM